MRVLLLILTLAAASHSEVRVLLVGVDYTTADGAAGCPGAARFKTEWLRTRVEREKPIGYQRRQKIPPLRAPLNDVAAMFEVMTQTYLVPPPNIMCLINANATAKHVLLAIDQFLVGPARTNDQLLFYYAGHGSQIASKINGDDGKQETFVTFDADADGGFDLRDKEVRTHLLPAVKKRAVLTVILEKCHAEGSVRAPNPESQGPIRLAVPQEAGTAPPIEITGKPLEEQGVLVLAASKKNESAFEDSLELDLKNRRGVFSFYLTKFLRTAPTYTTAAEIERVLRRPMEARDGYPQHVSLEGVGRREQNLFGEAPSLLLHLRAPVTESRGGRVKLSAGPWYGVFPGAVLRDGARALKVTQVINPVETEAVVIEGGRPEPGRIFAVTSFVLPAQDSLRLTFPQLLPAELLLGPATKIVPAASQANYQFVPGKPSLNWPAWLPLDDSPKLPPQQSLSCLAEAATEAAWSVWWRKSSYGSRDAAPFRLIRTKTGTLFIQPVRTTAESYYAYILRLDIDGSSELIYPAMGESEPALEAVDTTVNPKSSKPGDRFVMLLAPQRLRRAGLGWPRPDAKGSCARADDRGMAPQRMKEPVGWWMIREAGVPIVR